MEEITGIKRLLAETITVLTFVATTAVCIALYFFVFMDLVFDGLYPMMGELAAVGILATFAALMFCGFVAGNLLRIAIFKLFLTRLEAEAIVTQEPSRPGQTMGFFNPTLYALPFLERAMMPYALKLIDRLWRD